MPLIGSLPPCQSDRRSLIIINARESGRTGIFQGLVAESALERNDISIIIYIAECWARILGLQSQDLLNTTQTGTGRTVKQEQKKFTQAQTLFAGPLECFFLPVQGPDEPRVGRDVQQPHFERGRLGGASRRRCRRGRLRRVDRRRGRRGRRGGPAAAAEQSLPQAHLLLERTLSALATLFLFAATSMRMQEFRTRGLRFLTPLSSCLCFPLPSAADSIDPRLAADDLDLVSANTEVLELRGQALLVGVRNFLKPNPFGKT